MLEGEEFNEFFIQEIYEHRATLSEVTGVEWHVDHVIPMCGETVSGLHVWYNLQLLPTSINLSKSNKVSKELF